ncbi:hypothetical protein [Tardiphaga sp. 839_C3_N1_4]|uniref:hypothetical protein n=1 Tax=Tardiphaga sp. 839_C3_N1_4 TaxID=3240761 RepID=UPI003F23B98F
MLMKMPMASNVVCWLLAPSSPDACENGGSSVAMLAFIGTLVSQGALNSEQLIRISSPLLYFGAGITASVLAAAASYFANLGISHQSTRRDNRYDEPFVRDNADSLVGLKWANRSKVAGVICVLASIGLFITGLVSAKGAFSILTPQTKQSQDK